MSTHMNAIVNTGPGTLEWQTLPTPEPAAGQVRVRTAACGICATDLQMIAGWERTGFPSIPGHEWSGVVDAVGNGVNASLVGQPCVAENVWADGGEVGFEHSGGYGQCFLTEARLIHVLPAEFPLWAAPLIEPLAVCVRAMRRLRGEDGPPRPALIFGDGPIGLLLLLLLRRAGAEVSLVGGRPARLAIASSLGASCVMNYHDPADAERLANMSGTFGTVVEASGGPAAMTTAMRAAARGAKILVIGDYGHTRADFPWNQLLHQELELVGSNASADAWPHAVTLATNGTLPLERLITHRLPARDFHQAIELTRHDRSAVKVVIEWEGSDSHNTRRS